jgi:hypothetical protein
VGDRSAAAAVVPGLRIGPARESICLICAPLRRTAIPSLWFGRNKVKGPKKPPPVPERIPPRPLA